MHVEHAQCIADHEDTDGDHEQGAGHWAECEERTKPAEKRAKQSVCDKFCDEKKKNGKGGVGADWRFLFFACRLPNIILFDLMRERACQQTALHREAT